MKVLVTGGAGFIGHNVVRQLEQLDHECLILDTHTDYGFVPSEENKYLIEHRLRRVKATCKLIDIRHPTFTGSGEPANHLISSADCWRSGSGQPIKK